MGNCNGSLPANPTPSNFFSNDDVSQQGVAPPAQPVIPIQSACFVCGTVGQYCDGTTQKCFGVAQGSSEWEEGPDTPCGSCGYCGSCSGIEFGNGFGCNGGCSIAGARRTCRRKSGPGPEPGTSAGFQGKPSTCCRRTTNTPGVNAGNLWFEDNSATKTCDPVYRGFTLPTCKGPMAEYCAPQSPVGPASQGGAIPPLWTGTPNTSDCLRFIQENASNLSQYGQVVGEMLNEYLNVQNNPITSPASDGANHDPFIDQIVTICRSAPGACDAALTQKCQGITRDSLGININLANLCGCFMDSNQYSEYAGFGVTRVCDPVCSLGTSVKPVDPSSPPTNATFLRCNQSICVMDDITIKLLSSVSGNVTFSQACGNCGAGNDGAASCRCFISDTTVQAINSLVGDVSFQQACGNTTTCYQKQPNGVQLQVDCATSTPTNTTGGTGGQPSIALWIFLIILIIIFIIALYFALRKPKKPAQRQELIITQEVPRSTRPLVAKDASFAPTKTVSRPII